MSDNKTRPRIYRHSWWESVNERRKFVIVGLQYAPEQKEPVSVEVLEFGKPVSYPVDYKVWQDQAVDGKIIQFS